MVGRVSQTNLNSVQRSQIESDNQDQVEYYGTKTNSNNGSATKFKGSNMNIELGNIHPID